MVGFTDLTTAAQIYLALGELAKVAEFIDVDIAITYVGDGGVEGTAHYHCKCSQGAISIEEKKKK